MKYLVIVFISVMPFITVMAQFYTITSHPQPQSQPQPRKGKAIEQPFLAEHMEEKGNSKAIEPNEKIIEDTESSTIYKDISLPLKRIKVTSPFGMRKDPFTGEWGMHNGIDLYADKDEVYAMLAGTVKKVGYDSRSGNYVILQHGEYTISYCHLSAITVKENTPVLAGDVVGITGNTGRSTGEHLHVTCRRDGRYINPSIVLNFSIGREKYQS